MAHILAIHSFRGGTGKSNLFNHFLDPQTQHHYLGEDMSKYIFVRVNFHYMPDFSVRSVYSLILEQFELLEVFEAWQAIGKVDDAFRVDVLQAESGIDLHGLCSAVRIYAGQ